MKLMESTKGLDSPKRPRKAWKDAIDLKGHQRKDVKSKGHIRKGFECTKRKETHVRAGKMRRAGKNEKAEEPWKGSQSWKGRKGYIVCRYKIC